MLKLIFPRRFACRRTLPCKGTGNVQPVSIFVVSVSTLQGGPIGVHPQLSISHEISPFPYENKSNFVPNSFSITLSFLSVSSRHSRSLRRSDRVNCNINV